MAVVNPGSISWSISHMLGQNSDLISNAIDRQTNVKSWFIIGAAIIAVVLIVKRMGK